MGGAGEASVLPPTEDWEGNWERLGLFHVGLRRLGPAAALAREGRG